MNQELLKQSIMIFDTQEKWDALFEIHAQCDDIINHWLTIGARAMREDFAGDFKWECEEWGNPRDTRWYLKEFGKESAGIGFGWTEVELHLHLKDSPDYRREIAVDLLESSVFKPLMVLFELKTPPKRVDDGDLAYNETINPFSSAGDRQVRRRELAWQAAHRTGDYVRKMGAIIRRLTDDPILTDLFGEFNRQIRERTSAVQVTKQ